MLFQTNARIQTLQQAQLFKQGRYQIARTTTSESEHTKQGDINTKVNKGADTQLCRRDAKHQQNTSKDKIIYFEIVWVFVWNVSRVFGLRKHVFVVLFCRHFTLQTAIFGSVFVSVNVFLFSVLHLLVQCMCIIIHLQPLAMKETVFTYSTKYIRKRRDEINLVSLSFVIQSRNFFQLKCSWNRFLKLKLSTFSGKKHLF